MTESVVSNIEKRHSDLPGYVYTFYSYKGGVGRSMALANIGVLMATDGYKVLLVDWDLEAPGLEAFFLNTPSCNVLGDVTQTPGVIELLQSRSKKEKLDWRKCLLNVKFLNVSLDVISAGCRSDNYLKQVQNLNWKALFKEHDIGNYLNDLRESWKEKYDYVLIDSRTGVTDIGDICTVLMPDVLVTMFVNNHQNIEGVKEVVNRARKARGILPINRNKLVVLPLQGRDESNTEYSESLRWKGIIEEELGYLFKEWIPKEVDPIEALTKLYVPYVPIWSFGERLPVLENRRELEDPTTIGSAYLRITTLLASRLDWYSAIQKSDSQDIKSTKLLLESERLEHKSREFTAMRRYRKSLTMVASLAVSILGAGIYFYTTYINQQNLRTEILIQEAQVELALSEVDLIFGNHISANSDLIAALKENMFTFEMIFKYIDRVKQTANNLERALLNYGEIRSITGTRSLDDWQVSRFTMRRMIEYIEREIEPAIGRLEESKKEPMQFDEFDAQKFYSQYSAFNNDLNSLFRTWFRSLLLERKSDFADKL